MQSVLLILTFLLPLMPVYARAATQPEDLAGLLSRRILADHQPTLEVQVYTGGRVPYVPLFRTVREWQQYAARTRGEVLRKVILRGEASRWSQAKTRVQWLDVLKGDGYRVKKLRYEALPGLWIPALLYEPSNLIGKVPAVLNLNGHETEGMATPYIQIRCINLAKRGMLALNYEWVGKGQLNILDFDHYRMNQLDLCGTSGVAVHFLAQKRALDILLSHPNADPARVAATGLSGGSWQTIFLSSLDTRVHLINPVAGYSSFVTRAQWPELDLGDSEQTPTDLGTIVDYTHLTAMLAPRPTLLTHNAFDNCCFRADYAVAPLLAAARPVFGLFGLQDRLHYHINFDPGHNYGPDNREAFYRILRDYFYGGNPSFPVKDMPVEKEVRSAAQLRCSLPSDNANFHKLALSLSRNLPRRPDIPQHQPEFARWQQAQGNRLREIVRARQFRLEAETAGSAKSHDGITATYWRLKMDETWTVPAVELVRGEPKSTVILTTDKGRAESSDEVKNLIYQGYRVLATDPFYFGESKIDREDFLFAILVAALGDRPLGIQASQVASIARWLESRNAGPVMAAAVGPRSSLFTLVAAALEPRAIRSVKLTGSLKSLKEILKKNLTVKEAPELFCFGLLEAFDIPQLELLVKPRPLLLTDAQTNLFPATGRL